MWIFLPNAFLSIVDKGDPTGKTLPVRGRILGDIEGVFPRQKLKSMQAPITGSVPGFHGRRS